MRFTLILLLFTSTSLYAQVRVKLDYNKYWEITTPDSAIYTRFAAYDTTYLGFVGPVTDLYKNGRPQMSGSYASTKKEGEFIFYYEDGRVQSIGTYMNDRETGVWKYYYRNGMTKMELDFKTSNDEGQVVLFLDSMGNKLSKNDALQVLPVSSYQKFIVTEALIVVPGTDLRGYPRLRVLKNRVRIARDLSLSDPADQTVYKSVEQPARIPGIPGDYSELFRFMRTNLRYPPEAKRNRTEGLVLIEFVIEKDGTTTGFNVIKGIGTGCDEEAIRFLKEFGATYGWVPARQNGKIVRSNFMIPVKFIRPKI